MQGFVDRRISLFYLAVSVFDRRGGGRERREEAGMTEGSGGGGGGWETGERGEEGESCGRERRFDGL
jgi:hypothetical protein